MLNSKAIASLVQSVSLFKIFTLDKNDFVFASFGSWEQLPRNVTRMNIVALLLFEMLVNLNHSSLILLIIMGTCHQTIDFIFIDLVNFSIFLYNLILQLFWIRQMCFNSSFFDLCVHLTYMSCIKPLRILPLGLTTFDYILLLLF